MSADAKPVSIPRTGGGEVSGLWLRPDGARCLYVLAHGAGADMRHAFLDAMARHLGRHAIATLRYQFPYAEAASRRPDRAPVLEATVRDAVATAIRLAPDLPLLAGGKSMGGRMTSRAAAASPLPGVRGIAFLGFPLHPPKKPGSERAIHLDDVPLPMLFLQGTRDALADLERIRTLCAHLGNRSRLHVVEGGDHSFRVLKRKGPGAGRSEESIFEELAATIAAWSEPLLGR